MKKLIISNFIIQSENKTKDIFSNIINLIFLISLTLVLTIGRTYPLNFIANASFIVMSILMLIYTKLFGSFFLDRFVILILLINMFFFISSILNGFVGESFTLTFLTMGIIPSYFYFKSSLLSRKIAINYLTFAYIAFNLFFLSIYSKELFGFDFTNRLGDKIANQNDIATYLLTAHSIYFYLIIKKHYYLLPLLLLNGVQMISTGSRSGLLNILIMSSLIAYILIGKKRKVSFIITTVGLLTGFYLILFIPELASLQDRFHDLFLEIFTGQRKDVSTSNRINLLFESVEFFIKNPLFGGGRTFASKYTFDGNVAHNAFVEIAASYGIFVMSLFVLLFTFPLYQKNNRLLDLKITLIMSFVIFFFTLSGYYYKAPYYILPILATLDEKSNYSSLS